jgi:hypothetical protein
LFSDLRLGLLPGLHLFLGREHVEAAGGLYARQPRLRQREA